MQTLDYKLKTANYEGVNYRMNLKRILTAAISIMLIFTACGMNNADETYSIGININTSDTATKATEDVVSKKQPEPPDTQKKTVSENSSTSSTSSTYLRINSKTEKAVSSTVSSSVSSKPTDTTVQEKTTDNVENTQEETYYEYTVTVTEQENGQEEYEEEEQKEPNYAAGLYCIEDGEYLYKENEDERTAPASITKMLTASVVLKYLKEDDVIEVGTELDLVNPDSSLSYISTGNRMTVRELLYGMLLPSGNDAAYIAAVNTARRVYSETQLDDKQATEKFCELMNDFAKSIGMENSRFVTPDGWDDPDHYTTVSDLVKLGEYVMTVPLLTEIMGTYQHTGSFETGESITWTNTNKLVDPYNEYYKENAIGLKTGTTDNAGYCLAAAFKEGDKTYITVVMGCRDTNDRYVCTEKMLADSGLH